VKILARDLGKFNTMCCFFDSKTRKHTFLNATTDRHYLTTVFKKHKVDLVLMEACGPSGWNNDLAHSLGLKTLVCSTNEDGRVRGQRTVEGLARSTRHPPAYYSRRGTTYGRDPGGLYRRSTPL
jgi:hypothetical protein